MNVALLILKAVANIVLFFSLFQILLQNFSIFFVKHYHCAFYHRYTDDVLVLDVGRLVLDAGSWTNSITNYCLAEGEFSFISFIGLKPDAIHFSKLESLIAQIFADVFYALPQYNLHYTKNLAKANCKFK